MSKLTNAQHVFMMDCWWNASVEHQGLLSRAYGQRQLMGFFPAIDRVHRIGQDKPVYVTHFIVRRLV